MFVSGTSLEGVEPWGVCGTKLRKRIGWGEDALCVWSDDQVVRRAGLVSIFNYFNVYFIAIYVFMTLGILILNFSVVLLVYVSINTLIVGLRLISQSSMSAKWVLYISTHVLNCTSGVLTMKLQTMYLY